MKPHIISAIGTCKRSNSRNRLQLNPRFKKALLHLDKFSHIHILWMFPGEALPAATNTENSFEIPGLLNRIRLSVAKVETVNETHGIIEFRNGRICVPPGALVVDIKPYMPIEDRVKECRTPELRQIPATAGTWSDTGPILDIKTPEGGFPLESKGVFIRRRGTCAVHLPEVETAFFENLRFFSHIRILWWFSRFEKPSFRRTTQCNPPYENAPRTGVFASRSPVRPNPVGLTTVRVAAILPDRKTIEIHGTDAFDKTPVLDILPYIPQFHRIDTFRVPEWINHWSQWHIENSGPGDETAEIDPSDADFDLLAALGNAEAVSRSEYSHCDSELPQTAEVNSDNIIIRGARKHNLKDIDVQIPKNKITVITGMSGSGKSSLAFDTIYAESQRRFMESVSAAGRSFFKQYARPDADRILNLPPAIAVEQKSLGRNSRSTVGTVSDISSALRLLFARIGIRHCPDCGRAVKKKSPHDITALFSRLEPGLKLTLVHPETDRRIADIIAPEAVDKNAFIKQTAHIVNQALKSGKGAIKVKNETGRTFILHTRNHCYYCNISLFELTPSSFSTNNPESMCPECDGLGVKQVVAPDLIISDPDKSILDGASGWWGNLRSFIKKPNANWMKGEIAGLAGDLGVDLETPWKDLPEEFRHQALFGTSGRPVRFRYSGPKGRSGDINRPVEGAVNHIRRLFSGSHGKSSSQHYLEFIRKEQCPACKGDQLSPEACAVTVSDMNFPAVTKMSVAVLNDWLRDLPAHLTEEQFLTSDEIINSIRGKIQALMNVGLHYLSLKRSVPSLSGGESQRLRLANQLGCGLTNLLYILDEPSSGLHCSDRDRLVKTMKQLRDMGNTLVVVEHDLQIMRQADHIIDIGPGAGTNGGRIIAQGPPSRLMDQKNSTTGAYLKGVRTLDRPAQPGTRKPAGWLKITGATLNNLKNIDAQIPLGMLTCVTGKSGSGKSSLITKTLAPALSRFFRRGHPAPSSFKTITGMEPLQSVVSVTQEAIGRNSRSNPATYTGVFDDIRKLFAGTKEAKAKKYNAGRFSFNGKKGQCPACSGDGSKKVTMGLIPDLFIPCTECRGKRFNPQTLDIQYNGKSIADVLEMDIDDAAVFFRDHKQIEPVLTTLIDVGLGYLKLGQSAPTLSGGEAQRIKLAAELSRKGSGRTLYLLDEPTSGLHMDDIAHILKLLHRITASGNTVVVIEHHLHFIRQADWIIDLGPGGGEDGGGIVAAGTPEDIMQTPDSPTGRYMAKLN